MMTSVRSGRGSLAGALLTLTLVFALSGGAAAFAAEPVLEQATTHTYNPVVPSGTWIEGEFLLYEDHVLATLAGQPYLRVDAPVRKILDAKGGLTMMFSSNDDYNMNGYQVDWVRVEQGGETTFFDDFNTLDSSVWRYTFYDQNNAHMPGATVFSPDYGTISCANGVVSLRPSLYRGGCQLYSTAKIVTGLPARVTYRIMYTNYSYRAGFIALPSEPVFDERGEQSKWAQPWICLNPGTTGHAFLDKWLQAAWWNINDAVSVTANAADVAAMEAATASNSGAYADEWGHPVTLSASKGQVVDNGDGTWSWSLAECDTADSGPVTITADDGYGKTGTATFELAVENVAPSLGAVSGPAAPMPVGSAAAVSAVFTDPGTCDSFTSVIDWGDGTIAAGDVAGTADGGTVSGSHQYTVPGVYTVRVRVTDKDGGADEESFQYVAVYDPIAGFVTGGGTIESPAGAYAADPCLSGKASFGFVAKYDKGATVPKGSTEFQFHAGGLDFKSTSYDWLVVNGYKAQYAGTGSVNGATGYAFTLSAKDGQSSSGAGDYLRIRIWDAVTGAVVYDNQGFDAFDADPTTGLTGGNIAIHKD